MMTLEDARRVISAAENKATEIGQPMNIAVTLDTVEFQQQLAEFGRPKIIMAGISIDNCVLLTALDLLRAGYEVYVGADISGTSSLLAEQSAMMRLAPAGAVMVNWTALASELMGDWTRPNAAEVGEIYQQHSNWAGLWRTRN